MKNFKRISKLLFLILVLTSCYESSSLNSFIDSFSSTFVSEESESKAESFSSFLSSRFLSESSVSETSFESSSSDVSSQSFSFSTSQLTSGPDSFSSSEENSSFEESSSQESSSFDNTEIFYDFDGYIWNNGTKTETTISHDPIVVEDSLDMISTRNSYFNQSTVSLIKGPVVLLSCYDPYCKTSLYSGIFVDSISIDCKSSGTLLVGQIDISTAVNAREDGLEISVDYTSYYVDIGINTLFLNLKVGENSTLILSGNVELAVINDFESESKKCVFTTVDGLTHYGDYFAKDGFYLKRLIVKSSSNEDITKKQLYKAKRHNYLKECLAGKKISILGDSVSSFEGYSNDIFANSTLGNNVASYPFTTLPGYELDYVEQTYWMQTITHFDMELCVSNTWGGSGMNQVTGLGQSIEEAGYYYRCENLHRNVGEYVEPDIILVLLGVNDVFWGDPMGDIFSLDLSNLIHFDILTDTFKYEKPQNFVEAYAIALHKMVNRYPNATIIPMGYWFNTAMASSQVTENLYIQMLAKQFGCPYIDLYDSAINESNVYECSRDGMHPNYKGMNHISDTLESNLASYYLSKYDFEKDCHVNSSKFAKVFVLAGQSNASGMTCCEALRQTKGEEEYERYSKGFDRVHISYAMEGIRYSNGFENVKLGQGPFDYLFGPELGFADQITKIYPNEDVYLIKYTRVGSSLVNEWLGNNLDRGRYYNELKNYIVSSLIDLYNCGINAKLYGICWAQGEGDSVEASTALSYFDATNSLVSYLRQDLMNYSIPRGLVFCDVTTSENSDLGLFYSSVDQAKLLYSTLSIRNTIFSYSENGLSSRKEGDYGDNVHLNSASQILYGQLFAKTISTALSEMSY